MRNNATTASARSGDRQGTEHYAAEKGTSFLQALEQVKEYWFPQVIGRVNDQYVKVAKLKGQLAWHKHELEDELFLVVYGRLRLQLEDEEVELHAGEFLRRS